MNVIIAGSRGFNNYPLLKEKCDELLSGITDISIVSGTARGADKLGEQYAKEQGYNVIYCPANWDKYGKSAGYRRNDYMASISNILIAFWDGKSKGTMHMMRIAKNNGLIVHLVKY